MNITMDCVINGRLSKRGHRNDAPSEIEHPRIQQRDAGNRSEGLMIPQSLVHPNRCQQSSLQMAALRDVWRAMREFGTIISALILQYLLGVGYI